MDVCSTGGDETVIYSLGVGSDAQSPGYGSVFIAAGGQLLGVASGGGANGSGAVFSLD